MNTLSTQAAVVSNAPAGPPFYTWVAALGFVLIALTGLISAVVGLLAGDTGSLSFALPILIIGLLIAGVLWRFGVWAQIVAVVLSFLLLALVVPFSTFNLLHPEDGAEFIPLVLLVVGAALGFIGCVVGLVQRRRHTLRAASTPTESLALKVVLAAVALIAVASLVLTATGRTTVSAAAKANALSVEQKNYQFSPNNIQAKAGQKIRIVVKNDDTTLHTFTLNESGVDVSVPPGAERLIEFQAPASGAYQWYCIPHSDPGPNGRTGMTGSLTVQ